MSPLARSAVVTEESNAVACACTSSLASTWSNEARGPSGPNLRGRPIVLPVGEGDVAIGPGEGDERDASAHPNEPEGVAAAGAAERAAIVGWAEAPLEIVEDVA